MRGFTFRRLSPNKLALTALILVSLPGIALLWIYFGFYLSYDSVPNKVLFWAAMAAWAAPPILVFSLLPRRTQRRAREIFGDMLIGMTLVGAVVVGGQSRWPPLVPIAEALIPGFFVGLIGGGAALVVWRVYKGEIGK